MSASPVFVGTIRNAVAQIQNADASNLISLFTPGASGSKVEAISLCSTDTVARDIQLVATKGGVDYILGIVNVPINAGNVNTTPAVDLLANLPWAKEDAEGKRHLLLDSTVVLKFRALTTVTAAKAVQSFVVAGDL